MVEAIGTPMTEAILKPEKTPAITPGICSGMEATSSAYVMEMETTVPETTAVRIRNTRNTM